ncbi:hypothetical protein QVD17_14142 [Tagetes erecta]|uniref:Uncharacterized protein n=1 Tax=Tagetes erecta TaxID=13708 RepID=A0AAD8P3U9_TARER|nr:hypothetical protein QVD17_14142 [Tagetes erecta]
MTNSLPHVVLSLPPHHICHVSQPVTANLIPTTTTIIIHTPPPSSLSITVPYPTFIPGVDGDLGDQGLLCLVFRYVILMIYASSNTTSLTSSSCWGDDVEAVTDTQNND